MSQTAAQPPIHAMVMCAGLGERLRPLTEELPKPLMPVGDRPVLAHIAQRLRRAGFLSALANTHWLHEKFDDVLSTLEITLNLVHEPEIRGVAGGIAGVRQRLSVPVVIWNGDILMDDPPLGDLVARVRATSSICLAAAPTQGAGTLGLDAAGRVVRVRGETFGTEVRAADYVGLAGLGAAALAQLPERGCLIGDYCLPLLRRGEPVDTCPAPADWSEVGSLPAYARANQRWLARHSNLREASYVHPSASVGAGVRLVGSIVGAHARVEGSGTLERCIVWPGSCAVAPLERQVVTPRQNVSIESGA